MDILRKFLRKKKQNPTTTTTTPNYLPYTEKEEISNFTHARIIWSIKNKYNSFKCNSRICGLCLHEKLEIVYNARKNY